MTYCVALKLKAGLIMLSDTRTNAGIDNVSQFTKMFTWQWPDDRAICLMTSGNLSITQSVISLLQDNIDNPKPDIKTLQNAETMYQVAEIVGDAMKYVQGRFGPGIGAAGEDSSASIIISGQRIGGIPRLFLVYTSGNFIETTPDTCFFQIGEHKYGKPILDRVINYDTSIEDGVIAALLSMDSTLRSNLSVGMPLDFAVIRTDTYRFEVKKRIEADDESFHQLSHAWSDALKSGFNQVRGMSVYP